MRNPAGCTAVCMLYNHETSTIYVGNAGDSRAILSNNGSAVPLSFDHKPQNEGE
jgi:protein phosphatase 2C family protein 2/3